MKKTFQKQLVSAMISGLALTVVGAPQAHAADAATTDEKQYECHGVNSCKGKGECGGKGHSCAGSNSCKGQGFIYTKNKADCDDLGAKAKKKKS